MPAPIARWIVPSIFSSKSVFRMCRWIPGLQPIPSSPSTRAPSSRSSAAKSASSPAVADASTTRPPEKTRRAFSTTWGSWTAGNSEYVIVPSVPV